MNTDSVESQTNVRVAREDSSDRHVSGFIIEGNKRLLKTGGYETWFVVAPPGYYRKTSDQAINHVEKDSSKGAEWGEIKFAYLFPSRRGAARVANKCVGARIRAVHRLINPIA